MFIRMLNQTWKIWKKNRHHHLPLYFKKFQVTSQIYGWEMKELTKSIKFQRNKDYSARITFAKF